MSRSGESSPEARCASGRSRLAHVHPTQLAVSVAALAFLLTALVGLFWRRRARRLWLLPVHLVLTGTADLLVIVAPNIFRVWHAWAIRELVLHSTTLALVLEVALRVFAALPRASRHARAVLAAVLGATAVALRFVPWHASDLAVAPWIYIVVTEALPRLAYGAVWLCVALIVMMNVYHVPPDPLHRAVLAGVAAYLVVYSVGLGMQRGPHNSVMVYTVTPLAYTTLLAYWAWAAWRDEGTPRGAAPEAVQRLQPWR